MDNLDAIAGLLLGIVLLAVVSIREAMYLSVIPGPLSAAVIVCAFRRTAAPKQRHHEPSESGSSRCWPGRLITGWPHSRLATAPPRC
jgi:hypothetical protein